MCKRAPPSPLASLSAHSALQRRFSFLYSILTTASTSMVILDPRSRSRSRHSLSELVCEPRKQASSKCPTKKNEISGAHFFFRGRWEIANRNSRNLHDTQKPDKNGCRAVWMHSCTKPVLRRTSGGAAPESNCVPFHTPIPGRADPEQARQATSSINAADTRRDAVGDLSEGWRGDRLVRWLEEPKHLSTFFLFFFFWVFLRQRRRWPADSGRQCGHLDNTKES